MEPSITQNIYQAAFACLVADKAAAEAIALGLAGQCAFKRPAALTAEGPATYYYVVTHATLEFAMKFSAVKQTGIMPQPITGVWADFGIEDEDVLPTIGRMLISIIQVKGDGAVADTSRANQRDALLAEHGLVKVIQQASEPGG